MKVSKLATLPDRVPPLTAYGASGLHLVADLQGCPAAPAVMHDAAALQAALSSLADRHGFTVVARAFHGFPAAQGAAAGGVTGCLVLAESHVAVHTWPELGVVTLDVHVCNIGRDNTAQAHALADALVALFNPGAVARQTVQRGETWLHEPLNDGLRLGLRAQRLLLSRQTAFQRLEVYDSDVFGRVLRLDGVLQTSEGDEWCYHEPLVHTAAVLHPQPQAALIIGGGDGGALRQVLRHPSLRRAMLVELDEAVIDASRTWLPRVHAGAFDAPRVHIVHADGAAFLQRAGERFDLIVLDLPDPSGLCEALYGRESLRRCAERLSPHGRLTLHLGSTHADLARLQRLHAALVDAFAVVRPFRTSVPLYGGDWLMAVCGQDNDGVASAAQVDATLVARGIDDLQYYNGEVHMASFALPNYLRRALAA